MTTSKCPHCASERLTSIDGLVELQKKHDVWDGVEAGNAYFCGSTDEAQSGTCKLRVENSLGLALLA